MQKQDLHHVSQLPWGGSSASSLQIYAESVACTLSLRSVNSEDSGYASENAHNVSEDLLTNFEDKIEKQVGYGGKDPLKIVIVRSRCALIVPKTLGMLLGTHILFPRILLPYLRTS